MKSYWAIVSARFRMLLQYRAAALAGFVTQCFWGLILTMIYEAFYRSTSAPQPMTCTEVVTYTWLGQAMLGLLPWNDDAEVRAMIRSGTVAYELVRPLDLYALWFSRALATRIAPTLLRAVPMFIVAGLFLGLRAPDSWASAGAWLIATLGALFLSSAISTLTTISLLWTVSGDGIVSLIASSVVLFSGMIIPLPLFPDWAQPFLNALPFRGLVDVPFRLYTGHIPPSQAVPVFAHQAVWIVALMAVGRRALARGTRRLVVQGG
jgi:ABC-2 type transport system permease protein